MLGYSRATGTSMFIYRLILLGLSVLMSACTEQDTVEIIAHQISFSHKANKSSLPEKGVLYQQRVQSKSDSTIHWEFYMDVRSVFCGDDVCRVDPVRLYWDELGFFSHFTLKEGVTLEKGDGLDFEPQDYPKLQEILANRHSGLGELHKDELVREQSGGNGADALSGATVVIRKTDYIEGAIWTCYTLWHYANGEIGKKIRDIVGEALGAKQLKTLLHGVTMTQVEERRENRDKTLHFADNTIRSSEFALEQLARLSVFDINTQEQVVTLLKQSAPTFIGSGLAYLEKLPPEDYYNRTAALLDGVSNFPNKALNAIEPSGELVRGVLASMSFFTTRHRGSMEQKWADRLAANAARWNVYENVNRVFELIEREGLISENVKQHYASMLNHPNFLIARGAFWQLSRLPLSDALKQKVASFYATNAPKL